MKRGMLVFVLVILSLTSVSAVGEPRVLYTDIISGPNTGGENNNGAYLSIFGQNFGSNINDIKVYVGGGEVARYMYLGPSLGRPDVWQLSVQLGSATSTGSIRVEVDGVASNIDHQFTVRAGDFYFISHSGSDATGVVNDFSRPFRTGNEVYRYTDGFGAGDFIVIMNDEIYDLGSGQERLSSGDKWLLLRKTGTAQNPITIYGYPGATPTTFKMSETGQGIFNKESYPRTRAEHHVFANIKVDHNNVWATSTFYLGMYTEPETTADFVRIVNMWFLNGMKVQEGSVQTSMLNYQRADNGKVYGYQFGPQATGNTGNMEGHVWYVSHAYSNLDAGWNYIHDFPWI